MHIEHQIENVIQSPHMNIIVTLIDKISKTLRRDFNEIRHIPFEKRENFVKNYKTRAHKLMVEFLNEKRSDYGIISKEFKYQENAVLKWIINPLSGSENFMRNMAGFCCSISVMKDDQILTSVISDPIKQDLFYADENRGAFLNHKKIALSRNIYLNSSLFGLSTSINSDNNLRYRKLGSSLLNLAYVCNGRFDGCIEKYNHICDYAAAIPLIMETRAICSFHDKYIVCSGEKLSDHLMNYFNESIKNKQIEHGETNHEQSENNEQIEQSEDKKIEQNKDEQIEQSKNSEDIENHEQETNNQDS